MQAGFSKVSFLPPFTASLAGYGKGMPRHFSHVLDEPYARGIALSDGDTGVVVLATDFLTPTDRLCEAVRHRANLGGVNIVVHGTHTHSAPGNFWDHPIAVRMCGDFRPHAFEFLVERFAEAAVRAWNAREDARVSFDQDADSLAHLQENRRRPNGPIDPVLSVWSFRAKSDGRPLGCAVNFAGHPVIVAERDFHAVSADFPGFVARRLESEYPVCAYFNGAVGGLSIWFPETPIDVHLHLRTVGEPIAQLTAKLLERAKPMGERVAFSRQSVTLGKNNSDPLPFGWWWAPAVRPAVWYWNRLVATNYPAPRVTTVSALRIGESAMVFQPSDYGVGCGLAVREKGSRRGVAAVPIGHSDDYAGYIHPESEMVIAPQPGKDFRYLTIYENLMGFYGRGAYDLFARAEDDALAAVLAGAATSAA